MGSIPTSSRLGRCFAEALGTYLLIFFGCGAVHVAILTGALAGLWQVAIVWALAITVAIYIVGSVSGAHINPAITIALAAGGRFGWRDVGPYILAQLVGAFAAAATLFGLYGPFLAEKERTLGVVRGQPGSEITAMCYGEYFPNPGRLAAAERAYDAADHARLNALVPEPAAFLAEVLGTLVLALAVFALTDESNRAAPAGRLAPLFIGLTVGVLIAVIAPLTQACFNPARDFGPRLFAYLAGWGSIAIPGPRGAGFFTVYIAAPVLGALAGSQLYVHGVRPYFPGSTSETPSPKVQP
jgi:glycerol uptake facilitator protein